MEAALLKEQPSSTFGSKTIIRGCGIFN
jgi:hypothetical protein